MQRFRARPQKSGKTYYYFDTCQRPRKEIPLGSDYVIAVRKWAELIGAEHQAGAVSNFEELAKVYEAGELLTLAKSTQATHRSDIKHLRAYFNNPTPARLRRTASIGISIMEGCCSTWACPSMPSFDLSSTGRAPLGTSTFQGSKSSVSQTERRAKRPSAWLSRGRCHFSISSTRSPSVGSGGRRCSLRDQEAEEDEERSALTESTPSASPFVVRRTNWITALTAAAWLTRPLAT